MVVNISHGIKVVVVFLLDFGTSLAVLCFGVEWADDYRLVPSQLSYFFFFFCNQPEEKERKKNYTADGGRWWWWWLRLVDSEVKNATLMSSTCRVSILKNQQTPHVPQVISRSAKFCHRRQKKKKKKMEKYISSRREITPTLTVCSCLLFTFLADVLPSGRKPISSLLLRLHASRDWAPLGTAGLGRAFSDERIFLLSHSHAISCRVGSCRRLVVLLSSWFISALIFSWFQTYFTSGRLRTTQLQLIGCASTQVVSYFDTCLFLLLFSFLFADGGETRNSGVVAVVWMVI